VIQKEEDASRQYSDHFLMTIHFKNNRKERGAFREEEPPDRILITF